MDIIACIVIAGWAVALAQGLAGRAAHGVVSWAVVLGSLALAVAELV